jgi:hypothetical protein
MEALGGCDDGALEGKRRGVHLVISNDDSYHALVDRIRRKAPAYLDLLTAETDEDFEAAFEVVLDCAVRLLERNKTNFQRLDEVGLSAVLAGALTIPGLTVTQESHSNGHVDLTIEANHCLPPRIKLAEAKIYDGATYHIKGLEQLLGRYTTGREGRGLIISYVRQRDISELTNKLRLHMDDVLPLAQVGACQNLPMKWSFITVHLHSCGDDLQVGHVGCNLYVAPK